MCLFFFFFVVLSSLFCCFSPAIIDISIGRETCDSKKKGKRNAAKRTEHKKGQKKGKKKRHFVTCVFSSCSLGADIVIEKKPHNRRHIFYIARGVSRRRRRELWQRLRERERERPRRRDLKTKTRKGWSSSSREL